MVWGWSRPEAESPLADPPPPNSVPAAPTAAPPLLTATTSALPSEGAASAPVNAARPEETADRPADALASWARALRLLDIPPVALQAYGYAEAVLATAKPRCHLSWTLLAGIGAVESNHGRYGGAKLRPDGTSSSRIIGVPLAGGGGVELIRDTDRGTLDGDRTYDRAVGPMQFLPATWKAWSVDADGNRRADPYDVDDAALAAGYYLCARDQDLATGVGWASAVFTYNRVPAYVEQVYQFADAYGRAA
ncbi:Transglycosylase SLT domain-containing protein [Cryptosporangium aurantiacum]|uniref:Transglycosylase SLT domain-containing protein n=1 Tax=Cryptosporangium aurantiacum TaxID=134849 RepID=A0A1M7RH28_9ACTN|nr:Transglycosylase SLT domain-containing protein [Cryptosporangium aurantiacum]